MVAQHSERGFDRHTLQTLRVQKLARDLRTGNAAERANLRILGKVEFDTPLRVQAQQQTRKNQYPKKRIV